MKTAVITTTIALLPAMFSLAPAGQAPASQAKPQIAYVSGARILNESPQAKAEFARLPAMQKEKATVLRAQQQALEATRQQLAQAGDAATRAQLQQQQSQQQADLERATVQAQADLQNLQRQLDTDLKNRVKAVVEDLIKGQNIQMVVNDSAVVWSAPGTDLTPAVLERLNAKPAAK